MSGNGRGVLRLRNGEAVEVDYDVSLMKRGNSKKWVGTITGDFGPMRHAFASGPVILELPGLTIKVRLLNSFDGLCYEIESVEDGT